jgi:hypothetical protein
MKRFVRRGRTVSSRLSSYEVSLLSSLCNQLTEMLVETIVDADPGRAAAVASDDPFDLWARDLAVDPEDPELPDDPAVQRLFPNAYPHDAAASSDFRRFTLRDQRDNKLAAVRVVLGDLAATQHGGHPVKISDDHTEAWLKTLTNLRLSVATRLGITDSEAAEELAQLADDDPRAFMHSIYEWLGFAQETLLTAIADRL